MKNSVLETGQPNIKIAQDFAYTVSGSDYLSDYEKKRFMQIAADRHNLSQYKIAYHAKLKKVQELEQAELEKALASLDAEPAQAIKVPEGWKVEFPDTGYGEMIVTAPNGMIDIAHKDTEHVTEQLLRAILSGTKVE